MSCKIQDFSHEEIEKLVNDLNKRFSKIHYDHTPLNGFLGDFIYLNLVLKKYKESRKINLFKDFFFNLFIIRHFFLPIVKSIKYKNSKYNFKGRYLFTWSNIEEYCQRFVFPVIGHFKPDELAIVGRANSMLQKIPPKAFFNNYKELFYNFSFFSWLSKINGIKKVIKVNLNTVTKEYGLDKKFRQDLFNIILTATQFYESCKKIFISSTPIAVTTEYDRNFFNSILISAANRLNIPTNTFIHGTINDKNAFFPFNSHVVFCWGKKQKELIESWGTKARVIISGNQKLSIEKYNDEDIKKIKKRLSIPEDKYFIALTPNPILKKERLHLAQTFSKISKLSGSSEFCFCIKLHPSDNKSDYSFLNDHFPDVKIFESREISFIEFMNIVDFFVIHNSSIGLEAILYSKPVVVLDVIDTPLYNVEDLLKNNMAVKVKNEFELLELLKGWNFNSNKYNKSERTKFLEERLFRINGEAGNFIAKYLQDYHG